MRLIHPENARNPRSEGFRVARWEGFEPPAALSVVACLH
jgi:hypothetical protein